MTRFKSGWNLATRIALGALIALALGGQKQILASTIAQLGGLSQGHALFISGDGTMMEIDLAAASAERIALPVNVGFPDTAQSFALDPTSRKVLVAVNSFVDESRLSLYGFDNLKKPQKEFRLNLFALQVAWTGRKGEFYADAVSQNIRPLPGARVILQDTDGGFSKHDVPRLKPVKVFSQQQLIFSGIPAGTAAFGATFRPDFETTPEFNATSMGQSPYYHTYLCVMRDWQIIKSWPAGSAQAVASSFDGQTILARYQLPTKDASPLEMAKFDVKTGQIQKCDWLPPDTLHLLCASDDLNDAIIPMIRGNRDGYLPEFRKTRDQLFADVPSSYTWCIAFVSAKRPPVLIRALAEPRQKMFDFAAMTTAPGEYWITDGTSLWHLSGEGLVTRRELKIK